MLMDYMKGMSSGNRLDISEGRIVVKDKWFAFTGELSLDEKLSLDAQGTISSNKSGEMLTGIKAIMGNFPLALERMMKRIGANENKTQSLGVGVRRGILSINGAPVGPLPSVPELMHLHGRGL